MNTNNSRCRVLMCLLLCMMFARAAPGWADVTTEQIRAEPTRIVAIGDVHGDYAQFRELLEGVGLIDSTDAWIAGKTRFVQLGDIPDRGPDSRKAIDLLRALQVQAAEAGGAVHALIGNHEAMMMIGDLRYVHPGEYEAFRDAKSKARRKAYYAQTKKHIRSTTPKEEWPKFDKAHREAWEAQFPLGYVEHRLAWAPTGEYGKWVLANSAVLKLDDTLFVHGGLSPEMATMDLSEINTRVRTTLAQGQNIPADSIVEDSEGPLWHRAWGTGLQSEENERLLESVLAAYSAKRMVIAHTPLAPVVVPRFNGKVLTADVGLSDYYGHGFAALEIVDGQAFTLLGDKRIKIPENNQDFAAYFDAAQEAVPDPSKILRYLKITARQESEAAQQSLPEALEQVE